MKRAFLAGALGAAILACPAKADPRLVERLYNPDEVVRIEGRVNVQATIKFGEDEHIENVAIGDSNAWQVTPNKRANLLFIKPLDPKAATNMTVVTDRHTYFFDLVPSGRGNPLYVLAFTYPEPIEAEPALSVPANPASPVEMAAATDPYAVVDPAQLNFAWGASGAQKLLPTSAFDDGEATFLAWPRETPVPAILVKDREGTEGPVNFAVRGETIVIDGVPREIVLRSGQDSALLLNNGPVRDPAAPELARAGKVK
ncbi:TrbG/VirB9 family P-type conjugative transfer protein [Altericroceibacterium xinjiangense]|uniref:TrbG/VirB9 family P-type conjugative transfer protein n=1 Tax=Altericroceibacterium xinjiangense TaxID=762261 RepID=UPI000F7DA4F8|nr:TrbG/VirB9 family P-type conjugative transfer protein [Altericroceibacterium xinjiangense]